MKILIIGCGRVGAGLARTLLEGGHTVTLVDKDPLAFSRLGEMFKGRMVVGVGFDRQVLEKAGIARVDGLAAVTASDEANVLAARLGRDIYHVPRVVARLYDIRQAEIYTRLGLQTIAPNSWGIQRIADLLLYSALETVHTVGCGQVEIVDVETPPLLIGKTVRELTLLGEIQVVAVTRSNTTFIPTAGTLFQKADMLHLAVLTSSAERLKQLLGY